MSSDNRTPRLHSFRIACAIASATLCATAIAQVAFSLKPAIEVLDNPVIADSPAYPALAISTLVPAVIGIATTILSAVLVWTIKSGDPFKKGSATCLKVLGILFVVQAATSLYAGSLKTSVSMFGGEGAVGAQEIASSFDWTSLVLGIDKIMAERKISSNELAERIGTTPVNLSRIKKGHIRGIRFNTLEQLCLALRCQPGDLLEVMSEEDARKEFGLDWSAED